MNCAPRMAWRPGLGLDQQRVDARVRRVHHTPTASAWNSSCTPACQQPVVGRALVGRHVVGAHADAALQPVLRIVQAAQAVDARQQLVDHAVHQLLHLPVAPAVQAGEVGHAAGRAHAAEKAVTFDEQGARAAARRADRGGQPGRAAAEHADVELAEDLGARWLDDPFVACGGSHAGGAPPGRRRVRLPPLGGRRRRRFGGVRHHSP
jgi:hypothetical protein